MRTDIKFLTIGQVAERCDIATSALRFYEQKGLIKSIRNSGNQRRYHPSMLRQISVITAAQNLGLTLQEISAALAALPDNRTPTKEDWEVMSKQWAQDLDTKIAQMQRLRSNLSGCIGCGCLSLTSCELFNANDRIAEEGNGPRFLIDGYADDDKNCELSLCGFNSQF